MKDELFAYQGALDYLYSFVDYSLTHNLRFAPDKFDLGRMVEFLRLLGNPHQAYPIIHVAGTKGKGSTAALVASSLHAAGYRTGFYTSPHLHDYTERIQVDGQAIPPADLVAMVEEVKPIVAQIERLTTFEITTAVSFLYFARQKVDVAVVEVGLGGRLDATNVVDPLVSVITSLSLDHMAVLGDTLGKIAFEKAGIIKPGRAVVLALQQQDAREVIEHVAAERGSLLVELDRDYVFDAGSHNLDGQTFSVRRRGQLPLELYIPLLGQHQVENAATAYVVLDTVRGCGLHIEDEHIRQGFASVVWPGRFEILQRSPLLVVDSAHNRDSARRLRQTLDDYLPGQPVTLIFGASEDKDIEGMFAELMPSVERVIVTQSIHPRAAAVDNLAALAAQHRRPAEVILPVDRAVAHALRRAAQEPNAVVLAAGSLFIAAAVRVSWQKMLTGEIPVD